MLIIYYKSDGEIFRVVSPYKNMEEYFGSRTSEYSLIFDCVYIDTLNDYLFNRYIDFKVNLDTKEIEPKENVLSFLGGK